MEIRDKAAWFDGADSWLTLPHLSFDQHPFAVSVWVMFVGSVGSYGILEQRAAQINRQPLQLVLRDNAHPCFAFYGYAAKAPKQIGRLRWYHLVFQYSGAEQEVWINGNREMAQRSPAYLGNTGETSIGIKPCWIDDRPASCWNGYISELRIYGRGLTREEIISLYIANSEEKQQQEVARRATEIPKLTTVEGVIYSNAIFGTVTPFAVSVQHDTGTTEVPLGKLPKELQKQFGYDPVKAEAYRVAEEQRKKLDAVTENFSGTVEKVNADGIVVMTRPASEKIQYTSQRHLDIAGGYAGTTTTPVGRVKIEAQYAFLVGYPQQGALAVGDHVQCRAYRDGVWKNYDQPLPRWVARQ